MNRITLIRGLPGSGKSTLAKKLLDGDDGHWEADMYFIRPDGVYDFNPTLIKNAHEWCLVQVERDMASGEVDPVVSNTFTQRWEMEPYFKLAEKYGFQVEILTATGNFKSIHNVPAEVIQRMKDRWESLETI